MSVHIKSPSGEASVEISLHGATLLSWVLSGKELIFLSKLANASNPTSGKGIRGGIPIVFPNFGPWECGPQHGFARGKVWTCVQNTGHCVVLELTSDEETKNIWNYDFKLTYTVTLNGHSLETSLSVDNLGTEAFDFTTLLHTYLRVPAVQNIRISGLENIGFHDSLTKKYIEGIDGDIQGINENVDRVYANTPNIHLLKFDETHIKVEKTNLPDTVLWNPWSDKAKGMNDFGDDEYLEMVCIEAGKVAERQFLEPSENWQCKQVLTA